MQKVVSRKVAAAMSSQQGGAFNSGAKLKVVQMTEMQKYPMEPPIF